jgi:hypothetical protein
MRLLARGYCSLPLSEEVVGEGTVLMLFHESDGETDDVVISVATVMGDRPRDGAC